MNNGRRLGKRKTLQVVVGVTILAWATQTLLHEWGYGQEVANTAAQTTDAAQASDTSGLTPTADLTDGDKFMSPDSHGGPAGTLEVRQDASVYGGDVTLKQICRWSDTDATAFTPIADLVMVRLTQQTPFHTVTVDDIRQTLHDAGVNISLVDFSGATTCTVTRTDARVDPHDALQQWIDSQDGSKPQTKDVSGGAGEGASAVGHSPSGGESGSPMQAAAMEKPDSNFHSLRDLLVTDVCQRLNVSPDVLQINFNPQDDKALSLVEPMFKFDIQPMRVRNLGNVAWDVTICTDTSSRKLTIAAIARAWQDEVIVAKPLAYKEILTEADFSTRRVLLDELPDQPLLRLDQCVSQQAGMDLKPGTIMTARLVDPVPLVKAGQLVTVTLIQGSVQIRSVARAMEQGSLGQSIKVRNETSRDTMDVTVTGPQEGSLNNTPENAVEAN